MSEVMYLRHYGLGEPPFSIAPNPRFLYMSERHREGLAHLVYGLGADGGFVLLSGEVGAGKTTLCRCLLEQIPPDTDVAFIFNPSLTAPELLATLIEELDFEAPASDSIKASTDAINAGLLAKNAAGRNTILIIDEAQNLSPDVLEQLRLLTNLETNQRKLLRFILLGQPELRDLLGTHALRQLDQRITARYHLGPLAEAETSGYISHRMRVAGGNPQVFSRGARRAIHALSGGVPRLINVLADRALLGAYVGDSQSVTTGIVRRAAAEVLDRQLPPRHGRTLMAAAAGVALAGLGLWWFMGPADPRAMFSDQAAAGAGVPVRQREPESINSALAAPAPAREALPATASRPAPGAVDPPAPIVASPPPGITLARAQTETWQPPASGTADDALTILFARWSAPVPEDGCAAPPVVGLQCIELVGSWLTVASFNRPAMLTLRLADGSLRYAALTELTDQHADIHIGGRTETVARSQLDRYWTGQFTALWQAPTTRLQLAAGMRGPDVAELRTRLAGLGYPATERLTTALEYDGLTERAVREFQADEGLAADGIAGAFTWVRLADRLGSPAPQLAAGDTADTDALAGSAN